MSHPSEEKYSTSLDKNVFVAIGTALTILLISVFLLLGTYFYSVVALLCICLVITYMLILPVSLAEKGIAWISRQSHKIGWLDKLTHKTPEANPRILAVLLVYFIFIMAVTTGVLRYAPLLTQETEGFAEALDRYSTQASSQLIDWGDKTFGANNLKKLFPDANLSTKPGQIHITRAEKASIQNTLLETTTSKGLDILLQGINTAVLNMTDLATSTVTGFIYCLSGCLLVFYFLLDGQRLSKSMVQILPTPAQHTAEFFLHRFHQVMDAFIRGQVLLGICTGMYMFIVYSFFGVPYAIFLGVFMALAECLPVVGTWIGITPALIVMLFTFGPLKTAFIWCFSYGYQTIKDNIIAPKVVGDQMGLHPLVVILALLICAHFAGFLGVLLALPLASILKVILQYITQQEKIITPVHGGLDTHHISLEEKHPS